MLYSAILAWLCVMAGLLSWDGGIAAALVGGVVWEAGGWAWALPLLTFFLTSVALSYWRREQKQRLGLGSPRRNWRQVIANGGTPALMALLYLWSGTQEPWFPAFVTGLACANADTWATEIGTVLGKHFFTLPRFRPAKVGEEGAISLIGLAGALGGSCTVALSALPVLSNSSLFGGICLFGFLGSIVDSLLGSSWEAGGKLKNDTVNFIAISFTTLSATVLFKFLTKT